MQADSFSHQRFLQLRLHNIARFYMIQSMKYMHSKKMRTFYVAVYKNIYIKIHTLTSVSITSVLSAWNQTHLLYRQNDYINFLGEKKLQIKEDDTYRGKYDHTHLKIPNMCVQSPLGVCTVCHQAEMWTIRGENPAEGRANIRYTNFQRRSQMYCISDQM